MSRIWTCIKCGWTYHFPRPIEKPDDGLHCYCSDKKPHWRADLHIPH